MKPGHCRVCQTFGRGFLVLNMGPTAVCSLNKTLLGPYATTDPYFLSKFLAISGKSSPLQNFPASQKFVNLACHGPGMWRSRQYCSRVLSTRGDMAKPAKSTRIVTSSAFSDMARMLIIGMNYWCKSSKRTRKWKGKWMSIVSEIQLIFYLWHLLRGLIIPRLRFGFCAWFRNNLNHSSKFRVIQQSYSSFRHYKVSNKSIRLSIFNRSQSYSASLRFSTFRYPRGRC